MKPILLCAPVFLWLISGSNPCEAQQLPLNQPVPDVSAFDETGKPFSFREKLKGHYSVIVFGCLT